MIMRFVVGVIMPISVHDEELYWRVIHWYDRDLIKLQEICDRQPACAEAYPDIKTLTFDSVPAARALEAAEAAARAIGLEAVVAQPGKNLVEGTDVTFWYGYKDDVVVRVRERGAGSVVDIRSKSRVGVSDLGANAKRVRALSAEIRRQLGG